MVLVDVREAARFEGRAEPIDPVAGHVPGAVNLPWQGNLGADGRFMPAGMLEARYGPLLSGGGAGPVFMCGSGVTACHGLLAMAHAGLGEGRLYAGSWSEWIRDPSRPVA
jgi:thiosulfate/3-mercaptopyruvate sulfurtransferase